MGNVGAAEEVDGGGGRKGAEGVGGGIANGIDVGAEGRSF